MPDSVNTVLKWLTVCRQVNHVSI